MNKRELAFCREYVKERSAERAALNAGYSASYSRKLSCRLLQRDHIRNEITRLSAKAEQMAVAKSETMAIMTSVDVINEFSRVAAFDFTTFIKPHPLYPLQKTFLAPEELSDEQKKVIKNIRIHKHFNQMTGAFICETYSYEFLDRERAIENLAKHYGIFDSKSPHQIQNNPFESMPTHKVVKMRAAIASIMAEPDGEVIDGKATERKSNGSSK